MNDTPEGLIRLVGKDLASAMAEQVNAALDKIVQKQNAATEATERQTDAVTRLKDGWKFSVTAWNNALGLLDRVVAGAEAVGSSIQNALKEQAIEGAFRAAFGAGEAALERMRTAAAGLVDDASLRELGTQAARAGLSLEQVEALFAASSRAAIGAGKDVRETTAAVLRSVSEGTDEAAKQLGLHVDLKTAADSYAASLGKATDQLTAAEKVAASLRETTHAIDQGFAAVTGDEASARLDRLQAKWSNLAATAKGFVADTALAAIEGVTGETDRRNNLADGTRKANALRDAIIEGRDSLVAIQRQFANDWDVRAIVESIETTRQYGNMLEALQTQLDRTGQHADAVQFILAGIGTDPDRIDAAIRELRALGDAAGASKLEEAAYKAQILRDSMALVARQNEEALASFRRFAGLYDSTFEDLQDQTMQLVQARLEQSRADERATNTTIASLTAQAQLAQQLGHTTVAQGLWKEASDLASKAQLNLAHNVNALEAAIHASNNKKAEALLLEAKWAAATFRTADAQAALEKAYAELKKPSGPGAPRRKDDALERSVTEAYRRAADIQAVADRALAEQETRQRQEANARIDEEAQRVIAERQRIQQAQAGSQAEAYRATSVAADQLTTSLQQLGGVQIDLRPVADNMQPLIDQIEALKEATDSGKGSASAAAAGIVAASARMTTGLVKNETARAAIMALVETAEGFRSVALGDYTGGALHFVSAGIYGTVAGMSLASGGGSRGGGPTNARSTPALNPAMTQPPAAAAAPPVSYNLYLSGATIVGSNEAQVGRDLARILRDHHGRSTGTSPSPR